jgi:hypothetical protein
MDSQPEAFFGGWRIGVGHFRKVLSRLRCRSDISWPCEGHVTGEFAVVHVVGDALNIPNFVRMRQRHQVRALRDGYRAFSGHAQAVTKPSRALATHVGRTAARFAVPGMADSA